VRGSLRYPLGVTVADVTPDEARAVAADAFVFGYPLVLMDVTRVVSMAAPPEGGAAARANEFVNVRAFPDASFTSVVSPNADTLYSAAWLDLASGPVMLEVPDSGGRYYLLPMMSGWTDVFASPGTRTTGGGKKTFAITGPGWHGELPADADEIRSPTAMVWLLGRTQTNGTADYENVHQFQDALLLVPLSAPDGGEPPPAPDPDPGIDVTTPPPDQVAAMDAGTFFGRLAALMVDNPPADADAPAMARFAAIGLTPGAFEPGGDLAAALDAGVKDGLARITALRDRPDQAVNGWSIPRDLGSYGTDYEQRAFVAMFGLGANLPEDAIYPHTTVDGDGQPLTGTHRYIVHFEPGKTPPARAFWSLTMYNERQYFASNPIDRYAIGDRDALALNSDGSLDLWLQHETPGPEHEPNWLPTPQGSFNLILRVYWPEQELIDGTWEPPPVTNLG
jgi:hypothetical protein